MQIWLSSFFYKRSQPKFGYLDLPLSPPRLRNEFNLAYNVNFMNFIITSKLDELSELWKSGYQMLFDSIPHSSTVESGRPLFNYLKKIFFFEFVICRPNHCHAVRGNGYFRQLLFSAEKQPH